MDKAWVRFDENLTKLDFLAAAPNMPRRYPRFLGGVFGEGFHFGGGHRVRHLIMLVSFKRSAFISGSCLRMQRLVNFLPP
jgi:hypothetical protein